MRYNASVLDTCAQTAMKFNRRGTNEEIVVTSVDDAEGTVNYRNNTREEYGQCRIDQFETLFIDALVEVGDIVKKVTAPGGPEYAVLEVDEALDVITVGDRDGNPISMAQRSTFYKVADGTIIYNNRYYTLNW